MLKRVDERTEFENKKEECCREDIDFKEENKSVNIVTTICSLSNIVGVHFIRAFIILQIKVGTMLFLKRHKLLKYVIALFPVVLYLFQVKA